MTRPNATAAFLLLSVLTALTAPFASATSLRAVVTTNNSLERLLGQSTPRRLATCSVTEDGFDYLGNDLSHVSAVPASDCCTLCGQEPDCGAYTWTPFSGGTCWLKSSKGNVAPNGAAVSAELTGNPPTCAVDDEDTDYEDNDILNLPGEEACECFPICQSFPDCHAFSWSNHEGGTCWLKGAKGSTTAKTNVHSSEVVNIGTSTDLEPNTDYVDNDIAYVAAAKAEQCYAICYSWSGCRAFAWSSHEGGTCWLKSAKGSTVTKQGVQAAQVHENPPPQCTLKSDVDYEDHDIANVSGITDPADCCEECRQHTGCHAFSWSDHQGGTCWLKGAKGSEIPKTGVVSAQVW